MAASQHLLDIDNESLPGFDDVYGLEDDDIEELYGEGQDTMYQLDSDDDFLADDVDDDDNLDINDDGVVYPDTLPGAYPSHSSPASPPAPYTQMCVICQTRPAYSKGGKSYTTCGLRCASELEKAKQRSASYEPSISSIPSSSSLYPSSATSSQYGTPSRRPPGSRSTTQNRSSSYGQGQAQHGYATTSSGGTIRPRSPPSKPVSPTEQNLALLTQYLSGARISDSLPPDDNTPPAPVNHGLATSSGHGQKRRLFGTLARRPVAQPVQSQRPPSDPCVVCKVKPCYDNKYVTCGLKCAKKLCDPSSRLDKNICTYCRRKPKLSPHNQCGQTCRDAAKVACLMCKTRPKHGRYHLCGKTCKLLATENTPLILEAPKDHETYDSVLKKFARNWSATGTVPTIKAVYKIIEDKNFLLPYDKYKKQVGAKTEVFRYHGTSRKCTLGTNGNTKLCNASNCALCCILKTSFKVALANPSGAFGAGVYSSSASNKAYSYSSNGNGAIILCKVILGTPRNVTTWNEVMTCPPGFNSVVYERKVGTTNLNETIVYTDDAIRPVFLMTF